ncbi:MarR family transcriptional regulator [Wukongibacter baidiensis]|uniref:MarR family winged helix-turn-helix transcriptional regulator n=1 Tax=Wukongibacter baidiensis TaxID=1723361 RepID=UPI003D7F246C
MNKYQAISMITRIRGEVFDYIESELVRYGIEGLVVSHGNILNILYGNEGKLTMKEIAEGINRSKSTVTQLIDKLIKFEYVKKEQSSEDKRYSFIILTEKGWGIKPYFEEISDNVINMFFKGFTDMEIYIFLEMLDRVSNNFD